jgi:predicted metalloendopeptidase
VNRPTFHVKIGYPDKWKDYSALEIKDDSYWANIERANEWDYNEMIAKAGKYSSKIGMLISYVVFANINTDTS